MFRDTLSGVPIYPVDAWDRLGAAIARRRYRLGLTQEQVADLADVSVNTIRHLENGGKGRMLTLPKIDDALGWARGFGCVAVLDGGEPQLADEAAEVVPPARRAGDAMRIDRPAGLTDEDWTELQEMLTGLLLTWTAARSRR